jgi:uncharacterized membrane protein required for colicin V production
LKILLALPAAPFQDWGMIAAVTQKSAFQNFSLNWFDLALVLILAFGFWRGRKRGMSRECLPVFFWLTVVLAGGFGYQWIGDQLIQLGVIRYVFGKNFTERTAAYVTSYLLIALVALIIFSILSRNFKAKLEGSNAFGGSEYYFGIIAGVIRYACMLIAVLALLNAPFYSAAEIAATKAYNNRWFGGGLKDYSGDFIPNVPELQTSVFKESLLGPVIKDNLSLLLIDTMSGSGAKKPGQH